MQVSQLIERINNGYWDSTIKSLYPQKCVQNRKERILKLANEFIELYGDKDVCLFSVPGRTELSGNHTDHNNGRVLAASVDIDILSIASKSNDKAVRIKSVGYREDVVDISSPSPDNVRKGSSSALIAGIADYFDKNGYISGGFYACTTSEVMTGSGLSSSAAFEVMCARIMSEFYNNGKVSAIELAKAGKYAENEFFGKPCGLMDQAACASGGCLWMDFEDGVNPITEKIDFDISKYGYCLCIVNTGGNHADLTDDYASVPAEMHSIATLMGKNVLRSCDEDDFMGRICYMRSLVGDRAIMRAMHYFAENKRVDKQKEALKSGDIDGYLELVKQSGDSSFKFLQNVYTNHNVSEQGISLALAITERFGAVCRVHGGGFAGTIQAYVKTDDVESYKKTIEAVFGEGSCNVYTIRPYGAAAVTENEIKG
ncbi:MAG: galactokinase [Clostridia bacterium]|nr:galactokinase [Clostridia bacterium]